MEHYNIQISIQQVANVPLAGAPKGFQQAISGKERVILDIASIKVSATFLDEAYDRAGRLLDATRIPKQPHLHRASCDDSGGNLVCGYPAGPTISSAK